MCNLINRAIRQALTRRGFIAGSAAGVGLIAPMMCSAVADGGGLDTRIQLTQSAGDASNSRTRWRPDLVADFGPMRHFVGRGGW